MNKDSLRRGDTPPSPYGMSTKWANRGYRQPSEDRRPMQVEDAKGEEAYQRCFADAARMNPPRVPNAAFFENSPSAMEYVQRKDRELFTRREATFDPELRNRNPNFQPHPKDPRRPNQSDVSPTGSAPQSDAVLSPAPPTTSHLSMMTDTPNSIHGQPRRLKSEPIESMERLADLQPYHSQSQTSSPPHTLEPQFGPTGPGRMLR